MSQRSAFSAGREGHGRGIGAAAAQGGDAIGLGSMPWKPAMTATSSARSLKRLMSSSPSMPSIRAEPWASDVRIGICQPCQERAGMPMVLQRDGQQAGGHLLPGRDDDVVFPGVCSGEASLHHLTSSLVLPDMAETTTAT
jgi:hypothetical protein